MSESANRKLALKDLSKAPREDSETTLRNLGEGGHISSDLVNGELDKIQAATSDRAKVVSETVPLKTEKVLSPEQQEKLLGILKSRFELKRGLHDDIQWSDVEKALKAHPEKLWSLDKLESSGGEPDVIGEENGEFVFGDCSAESPSGRRNVVFDMKAKRYLKKHYPNAKCRGNATDKVAEYGVDFMDVTQYCNLQDKLRLDQNTYSWLKTPTRTREFGYALSGSRIGEIAGVGEGGAHTHSFNKGFRASLRVKKA
jgi:hypothetical protein